MTTLAWPPLSPEEALQERDNTTQQELEWLLAALQDTLQSLKAGLDECAALLEPRETGSTLVLSSLRSECLKGFVTLNGTRIVKGDMQLRLPSLVLPPAQQQQQRTQGGYRLSVASGPSAPDLVIGQLVSARTLINSCLDVVDATLWTGEARNAEYISTQLRLLHENVREAKGALRGSGGGDADGGTDNYRIKPWHEEPVDKNVFDPPLPGGLSLHFSVHEAALILSVRTLAPVSEAGGASTGGTATPSSTYSQSYTGLSIRDRLAAALGAVPPQARHDEADETFTYKGQAVRVKEKLRIESQDPSLMVAMAKLSALEHTVAICRRALDVVMNHEDDVAQ